MDELKPQRLKWYQQFFDRIQTIGYNMDADDKMPIAAADLPLQGDREACLAAGMNDYLAKPFKRADLQRILQRWLQSRP